MGLSEKQLRYLREANRRWNIKIGAVRSGKSYVDLFLIPRRIIKADEGGEILLIGCTETTFARNILEPMRRIWGNKLVGNVRGDGSVTLFGRRCWVIGGSSEAAARKIQGCSVEYCYGDEITTWSEAVFEMLKSRLDRPGSLFDGTANPSSPNHWLRKFMREASEQGRSDVYAMTFTIDDNPALPREFVETLKREYEGTVWYDRFILGRWAAAEGCIYRRVAAKPQDYRVGGDWLDSVWVERICIGVDFGGNRSATSFVASAVCTSGSGEAPYVQGDVRSRLTVQSERTGGENVICVLASQRHKEELDPDTLADRFCAFVEEIADSFGRVDTVFCDNAEPVLIRGLRAEAAARGINVPIRGARKASVSDRIRATLRLISRGAFKVMPQAEGVITAMSEAVWEEGSDRRLDNGSSDIDTLDAFEYSVERDILRMAAQPLRYRNAAGNLLNF